MATSPAVKSPNKRLGAMLVEEGIISEGQLTEALGAQKESRGFLGSVLVDLGFLKEHLLINFLVKQCKIPHISLIDYSINDDLMQLVPREICIENSLIPIDKLGRILTIAMVDPLDQVALDQVREVCPDMRVKPILCSWHHFDNVIRKIYPDEAKKDGEPVVETFGLPPIKTEAKKPKPPEAAQQAPAQEAQTDTSPTANVDSPAPPPAQEPQQPAAAPAALSQAGPPSDAPTSPAATAFLSLVNVSVKRAMEEAIVNLTDRIRVFIAEMEDRNLPVSSAVFVETLREAIAQATDDAVGTLLYDTQEALSQSKTAAGDLTVEELSRLLRASMRTALQDASVGLLKTAAQALIANNQAQRQS